MGNCKTIQSSQPSGFLEWAEVHNNLYGTSRREVEKHLQAGVDVILDIDVQGAMQVRERSEPVSIFIAPPSLDELERRLRGRGTEHNDIITTRLRNATQEMKCVDEYDYLIINDSLSEAVDSLRSIIIAERCRHRRTSVGTPAVISF